MILTSRNWTWSTYFSIFSASPNLYIATMLILFHLAFFLHYNLYHSIYIIFLRYLDIRTTILHLYIYIYISYNHTFIYTYNNITSTDIKIKSIALQWHQIYALHLPLIFRSGYMMFITLQTYNKNSLSLWF